MLERCLDRDPGYDRLPDGAMASAVMVLLQYRDCEWHFILIVRAANLSLHAGETAFAGGRRDPGDRTAVDTALREVNEEIGVPAAAVRICGVLPFVMTLDSGFAIVPVVAVLNEDFREFRPDPREVDDILAVPVSLFSRRAQSLGPEQYFMKGHRFRD
ncbi:MAG TPA: CoA pyrophosphatase, partial [bacterium]|nr:CoA pyrophosphatase [bacterium]